MLRNIVFLFLMFVSFISFSQEKEEQLASHYYSNNEFQKAADIYEKLFAKNSQSGYFYENLLNCYFKLSKFDDAEKIVKKQIRKNDGNPYYQVDLGYVYKKAGNNDKAKKQFDDIINKLKGSEDETVEASNAFQKRLETDMAINCYLKARKQNGNNTQIFCMQLAGLYAEKKQTKLMIDEYLSALQSNPVFMEEIQGYLQLYLEGDAEYDLIKQALLKKVKEFPGNEYFSEMLIWCYVQRKDFDNALIQTKALDKRFKEDGRRLIDLGNLAVSNEKFDAASSIFSYVSSLGKEKPYYINSRFGMLDAKNRKIFYYGVFTDADLKILEKDYNDFITEFGHNYFSAPAIRDLARLQAYYLTNFESATNLFRELINMPRLEDRFKAECKLELGDIYLFKGEEWEAMLLYGQVDKDFLEDPLGQEAKLRNARLSYYLGEFEWARAQLDVLKTATTQLIANNALELSLLIQDNTVDSIEEPLLLFAKADLCLFQNKTERSLQILDSINLLFPRHSLDDDILYKRAEINIKKHDYAKACSYLEQLLKENGSDILGDNALFLMANITEKNMNDKQKAMKLYEEFIEKYPGSFFLTEVRKRFRALRGDQIN